MKNIIGHPNSRKITIYRTGSFLSRSQGAGVDDFFSASKQSIGSYFESGNSQRVGSGMTPEEEALIMPDILHIDTADREFRKKVGEFFTDLTTSVPHGTGVTLEVGLKKNNDSSVAKDNMPINLMDYVRYKHAVGHPWVGSSKEEASGDQTITFYIFDKSALQGKATNKRKDVDAAMQIYLKVKEDIRIVDQLLTLLGIDPRVFLGPNAGELKVEALRDKVEADPKKFAEVYGEGELEVRYDITSMINTGVLKQLGTRIIDVETDKLIGNSIEEVVYWYKDEDNSQQVIVLKARLQEALLKEPAKPTVRKTVLN